MVPRPSSSTTTAYALSLLSEYTHTLDSLPLDLSRNFADLRELDAVLSSSMASITTRIHNLTKMIEEGTVPKEERLWLLTEISEEAARLKLGGEDKIRVACQAADNLKSHTNHLRTLLEHLPNVDPSTLIRQSTTYPHVSSRSFAPTGSLDSSRRRRGGGFMTGNSEASPAKRRRNIRDDDVDGARSPRKERAPENSHSQRQRNGARTKKCVLILFSFHTQQP
jgi:inhibitor of growth protein 3